VEEENFMFIELMPLIEKRAITITVAALSEGRIRVNVVPMALAGDTKANDKVGYANKDKIAQIPESAIHALTTPLSLTGEPAEIDAQMAEQLKAYVDSHAELQQSVERAKREIADAVKAIEERDKNRAKAKSASGAKPGDKSADESKEMDAAGNLSLFDSKSGASEVAKDAH
jgi:PRTRC genetic system protein E